MKHEEISQELHELAKQLGVNIRYEKGDFEGGYCTLKDEKVVLINKRLMPTRKAAVLAVALQEIGLNNIYIKPVLREFIEDEVAKALRAEK
ncbi:MAG: hypothetical protein O7D34_09595 [Ignavibacteria bacterium]|nr:hypothetical protein [Ignavibacteria bacterium]